MNITDDLTSDQSPSAAGSTGTPPQMSRGAQTAWIVAAVLAAGVLIAVAIAVRPSMTYTPRGEVAISSEAGDDLAPQQALEAEHAASGSNLADTAIDEAVTSSPTPSAAPVDRELEAGMRHAIELNEMICRETGQNCEFAEMMRRQHEERNGGY